MSLLSPLAAMLIALGTPHGAGDDGVARQAAVPSEAPLGAAPLVGRGSIWSSDAASAGKVPIARQVRIERRVIMRITPQPGNSRRGFLSQLPRQTAPRVVERPHGECVDAGEIVGVADRGSRLVMYMRDRQIISAELEKACSPRDFYLGFYVERSPDGQLCVNRDRLMSRAGAKCRIADFHRLIAVAD